jgi:hypothetical protein
VHLHLIGLILWWVGLFLEAVILARMVLTRNFKNYPVFYLYILCVFLISGGLYLLYWKTAGTTGDLTAYSKWYWPTQLLTLIVGYGVILDFARRSFAPYPGADRFVRVVGLSIFFCIFSMVLLHLGFTRTWSQEALYSDLEKVLRVVEALFLTVTLLVLSYYRISIGKNLTGIALGMGFYVSASLTLLALLKFLGPHFYATWEFLQSSSYFLALVMWTAALWSYAPMPSPNISSGWGNYDELTGRTRADLESLRDYFGSGANS